jgi:hypothetical protein
MREGLRREFETRAETERAGQHDEVVKAVGELRNEIGEKLLALKERTVDAFTSRPVFDQSQVDLAVETAVARARGEFDRALEVQRREFTAQIQALNAHPVDALAGLERERQSRVEDSVERIREEFGARLAAKERAFDALAGLDRGRLSHIEESVDGICEKLRGEFEARLSEKERVVDVLANRPVFDQSQVDRAVEVAVARTRAELSAEFDRVLEAQRREFAVQLQALKERLGDVASRPNSDQSQIEHAAAAAAETVVAQLRVGLDDLVEAQARAFETRLVDLEARLKGAAGKLPVAKFWTEGSITYEAQVVTHNGATFQAVCDTAKMPALGDDWRCLARPGCDGEDGRSMTLRGEYDQRDSYARLDVVTRAGSCWIATRDNPGVFGESDGWLLVAAHGERGERGAPGLRGHRGDRGPAGAKIAEWKINREHFLVVPFLSDGTAGPPLRLRDLFQEFINQTG